MTNPTVGQLVPMVIQKVKGAGIRAVDVIPRDARAICLATPF
jgi:hypothetical protein